MISKLIRIVLVGSLLGAGGLFADQEDSLLHDKMGEVNRSLKQLRRAGDDYEKAAGFVQQAQVLMLECFPLMPYKVEQMPEGKEKQVALAEYKKLMAESYKRLCDLELAYLSGDAEEVDKAMEQVKGNRKEGHRQFIEQED